jgi:hypothetical protein
MEYLCQCDPIAELRLVHLVEMVARTRGVVHGSQNPCVSVCAVVVVGPVVLVEAVVVGAVVFSELVPKDLSAEIGNRLLWQGNVPEVLDWSKTHRTAMSDTTGVQNSHQIVAMLTIVFPIGLGLETA